MTAQELVAEYPGLTVNQIKGYQPAPAGAAPAQTSACPLLTWVRDEGTLSIMRATAYVDVHLERVRDGKWAGSVSIGMRPGDELSIRMRLSADSPDYDQFSC